MSSFDDFLNLLAPRELLDRIDAVRAYAEAHPFTEAEAMDRAPWKDLEHFHVRLLVIDGVYFNIRRPGSLQRVLVLSIPGRREIDTLPPPAVCAAAATLFGMRGHVEMGATTCDCPSGCDATVSISQSEELTPSSVN